MSNENVQTVTHGLAAKEWLEIFRRTGVEQERLEHAKSDRGRATIIGNFLGRQINREVGIEVNGRAGKATLRSVQGRSGKTLYYFEIVWDDEQRASDATAPLDPAPDGETQPARRAAAARSTTTTSPGRASTQESPIDRRVALGSTAAANDEAW
jgi:hypothetical protein